jgi:DNA-binding CsgD family transcriptional regulator
MPISEDSRFQKALLDLYESANLTMVSARIIAAVKLLIPGDVVAVTEINYRTGAIKGCADPEDYPTGFATVEESYEVLQRYFQQHPIVMDFRHTGIARRISDHWSAPEFHEKGIYCEFYRKLHVEDQVVLMMPTDPACAAGVAVSRGERSFRTIEVDRLNRLGPHIIQAYRNAKRITMLENWKTIPVLNIAAAMEELGLSRRQSEVLEMIAAGYSNAEAAVLLGVSALTIKKHLENIFAILNVSGRSAAVALLFRKVGFQS